ncbi:MAG: hypothetical protein R6T83_09180 [Salinibacter sp.]
MSEAQFDVERATAGLVMTLFVASALLLAGLLYFVMENMDDRSDESSDSASQAVRVEPPTHRASPSPSHLPPHS